MGISFYVTNTYLNNMVRDSSFINLEREAENNRASAVIFSDSMTNNLAHVLAEAGKRKKAEAAARSAVALAGPLTHLYRATLATILAEKR